MKRAPDDAPPDRRMTVAYRCQLCGAEAGRVELLIYDDAAEVSVVVESIVTRIRTWFGRDELPRIARLLAAGSPRDLYDYDGEWASFYCPDCDRIYCRAHWLTHVEFDDDDGMPAWYDCTWGVCPQGHRRIVDD